MTMAIDTRHTSESGFTLIELLVYMMLFGLVLSVAGTMLINSAKTSKTVTSVTEATTAGQLVAHSIERGIRNSSDFQLTSPSGTDQLLLARTASSGTTLNWSCTAWYYSAAGTGSIRYKVSSTAILPPTVPELATWTLLDQGIVPKIVEVSPAVPVHVFSATDEQLTLSFSGLAGNHPPVDITSSAVSRAGASGSLTCF